MLISSRCAPVVVFAAVLVTAATRQSPLAAQSYDLFINEVIADNGRVQPPDLNGGTPDMIEIHNASDELIPLGTGSDETSYFLSDSPSEEFDAETAWRFPAGISNISPGGRRVIFCDGIASFEDEALCELHASFQIASDGSEPITLFGPLVDGEREIVDRVWLPPLRRNVSFGRSEDGIGPRPMPIEQTLDFFVFNHVDSVESPPTFGGCQEVGRCVARPTERRRFCNGARNNSGANLEPRIDRLEESTNAPADMEPVHVTARVRDDKTPIAPNIARVEIIWRTRSGSGTATDQPPIAMRGDGTVRDGASDGKPLRFWSVWKGTIPGQPAGTRVEFYLHVVDVEGLESTDPEEICPGDFGPCDREFGGKGCTLDTDDVTCNEPSFTGERYIECRSRYRYASGYAVRPELEGLVINEIFARQNGLLKDETEPEECFPEDECPEDDPLCCTKTEDFIELHNGSASSIALDDLWLSDTTFHPTNGWRFPPGSTIEPDDYLIVWLDNDGGKCPDPDRADVPCFWECPDPTDPTVHEYHANFALEFSGDRIGIFDTVENNYGLVHGTCVRIAETAEEAENKSLALVPDGDRDGCFVIADNPTPGAPNDVSGDLPCIGSCFPSFDEPSFVRGDCNLDGAVNLTDAVFLLDANFRGGASPECPAACDANGDGNVFGQVTDAVWMLSYSFLGGDAPVPPFPDCGVGTREGDAALGCDASASGCE